MKTPKTWLVLLAAFAALALAAAAGCGGDDESPGSSSAMGNSTDAAFLTIRRDVRNMGDHGDEHMGMSDHEMGMDMDMTALEDAKPFDKAFIDAMVPHHQGAITMAEELLKNGEQPALREMAGDIISAQTKEIAQMRAWRKAWYGSASGSGDVDG
jgi:predicted outer membrane protein